MPNSHYYNGKIGLHAVISENSNIYIPDNWYLSADGIDTVLCGENMGTPCNTLTWLLTIADNKTNTSSIQIITDIDLFFSPQIMV